MAQHTAKRRGIVKGVRESWEYPEQTDVEMEEPPTEKQMAEHRARMKGHKGMKDGAAPVADGPSKPHGRSHHVTVPKEVGSEFGVGDAVELEQTLRHYGKWRPGGGAHKADEEKEK
jgi:hypothetical protein